MKKRIRIRSSSPAVCKECPPIRQVSRRWFGRVTPLPCAMILACLCLFAALNASSATQTWNGGAVPDGRWTTPGNWNGVAPTTNDLLIFTGGTQTSATNNFPAGTPFDNISFNSGASAFTLNGNPMILSSPTDAGSGLITGGQTPTACANA